MVSSTQGAVGQPIWMSNVACTGTEDKISDCTFTSGYRTGGGFWGLPRACVHGEDVEMVCAPAGTTDQSPYPMRLVPSSGLSTAAPTYHVQTMKHCADDVSKATPPNLSRCSIFLALATAQPPLYPR